MRRRVANWARSAVREARRTRLQVQLAMRKPDGWLSSRLSGANVSFEVADLLAFAKVIGVTVPPEILQTAERLAATRRPMRPSQEKLPRLTNAQLADAGTAEREIRLLLEAASQGRIHRERDFAWTARRLGTRSRPAETLEEIGASAGVTRERVRQVEAKVLDLASTVASGRRLPMLSSIHHRVLESVGLPWAAVEQELSPFLGDISLREAVRFYETVQPPPQMVGMDEAVIYGLNKLRVVATSPGDLRFTSQVSTAARKIFSFAGAALVHDIRALVETVRKKPVSLRDLVRTLDVLPGLQWLDEQRRWCWFATPELSGLLRHAAQILCAARQPVDMESLYAGLVREARRDAASQASFVADPLPPSHVVHAILKRHPLFRRYAGNAFGYVGTDDATVGIEPARRLILERLNALGGAATRAELYALEHHPEHPIPRTSFAFYLYCCGWLERIGPRAWAVRGRAVDEARRREVLNAPWRAPNGSLILQHARPSGPAWSVVMRLTEAARRNRLVSFPSSMVPLGSAGAYRDPDGHDVLLHDDHHGARVTRLGSVLKGHLADRDVVAIRFEFDSDARTLVVIPERAARPADRS